MLEVRIHQRVSKFLKGLDNQRAGKCKDAIDKIAKNPFVHRSGCDIKKLSGKRDVYRLRVGDCRFVYIVDKETVLVTEAFKREKGYR